MKSLTFVLLLLSTCVRAQTLLNGSVTFERNSTIGVGCSSTTYCASIETDIVQPPSTPNMGGLAKNGAIAYDTSYLSGTSSPVIRCTDTNTATAGYYPYAPKSAGLGGAGSAGPLFNSNDTLVHVNDNQGDNWIVLFDPLTLVCSPAITANLNQSSSGSSSATFTFGQGYFDWQNASIYHGAINTTQIVPYTINSLTGSFTVGVGGGSGTTGTAEADFQYALPYGSLVSAWQASRFYTSGQYVSYRLNSTQAPDWQASHSTYDLGDIIQPLTDNALRCALKLVQPGTTGSTEPNWNDGITACHFASWGTISDGTAAWQYFGPGSGATFLFQTPSARGTSGSATPAFVPTSTGHPDLMTKVSDNGLTWTNVGVETQSSYRSFAGLSYDGTRFCQTTSTDVYGYNGSYSSVNGTQGAGNWEQCYSSTLNEYVTLNTTTGWQSLTTCAGGTGFNCSGGSWVMNPQGSYSVLTSGGCGFFTHDNRGSYNMTTLSVEVQANLNGSSGCDTGNDWAWNPFQSFDSSTGLQMYRVSLNHYANGNSYLWNNGQDCLDNSLGGFGCAVGTFGYAAIGSYGGAYLSEYQSGNPYTLADILIAWQPTPCSSTSYSAGVTYTIPPCEFGNAYDSHLSAIYNPSGSDCSPVCGSIFNIQSVSPIPFAPWQGELICVPTASTWAYGSAASGQNAPWRFTPEFNTGTNSFFDVHFAISQCSTDGKFCAFSSDWMCTLGNTSGGSTSLCGLPWVPDTVYSNGKYVNPFSSTEGAGTDYGVYEVTTGGTSAPMHPSWFVCNSSTAGSTVTDANGLVYTCQGTSNGRGDVFIVQLSSNSVLPPSSLRATVQ